MKNSELIILVLIFIGLFSFLFFDVSTLLHRENPADESVMYSADPVDVDSGFQVSPLAVESHINVEPDLEISEPPKQIQKEIEDEEVTNEAEEEEVGVEQEPEPEPDPDEEITVEAPKLVLAYYTDAKTGLATKFWVGEPGTEENGFISNSASAWDVNWADNFGGFDDPNDRCDFYSCAFTPLQNPFYVALPYTDVKYNGVKDSQSLIPWYGGSTSGTILKNSWIEIVYNGKACYGQWQDVGPFHTDDFDYVFGDSSSANNTQGIGAAIDLSPALFTCLGMPTNDNVSWRFINSSFVPSGPWTQITTVN